MTRTALLLTLSAALLGAAASAAAPSAPGAGPAGRAGRRRDHRAQQARHGGLLTQRQSGRPISARYQGAVFLRRSAGCGWLATGYRQEGAQ